MSESLYSIGLSGWIIQDGNYADFSVGDRTAFALEFGVERLELVQGSKVAPLGLKHVNSATHDLLGRVIHVANDWWAVEAGICLFQERPAPKEVRVGSIISARCFVGIDPFFYFERLAHDTAAPPLIYDWRIARIELDETPWTEIRPRSFRRDTAREAWRDVQQTNAWSDDGGRAQYILHCELLTPTARHSR